MLIEIIDNAKSKGDINSETSKVLIGKDSADQGYKIPGLSAIANTSHDLSQVGAISRTLNNDFIAEFMERNDFSSEKKRKTLSAQLI